MTPKDADRLERLRQHQKDSEKSQMVFGPVEHVKKEIAMTNNNENARERWCKKHNITIGQSKELGYWYARYHSKDSLNQYKQHLYYNWQVKTPDAALRALCEANGWDVPGFLREEEG